MRSSNRSTPFAPAGAKFLPSASVSPLRDAHDSNRLSGRGRRIQYGPATLLCSLFVWGCAETQRDFYQAPPPEPAGWSTAKTSAQDLPSQVITLLSREGFELHVGESAPAFVHGRLLEEGNEAGEILVIKYDPQLPDQTAVEARLGLLGRPERERRLAEAIAAGLTQAPAGSEPAPPVPGPWSTATITGRWIDLEAAVKGAGVSEHSVDLTVVSVDRWRFAARFTLRTLAADEGMLIVTGDRESAAGPQRAYLRIGLFGDPELEREVLDRLQEALNRLGKRQRLPGAR